MADLGLDADSVIAALLHDTIEDTNATHEEVAKQFGETVAALVEGVTKLSRVQYTSRKRSRWRTCGRCSWPWPRTSG